LAVKSGDDAWALFTFQTQMLENLFRNPGVGNSGDCFLLLRLMITLAGSCFLSFFY
jgi:hypothetical protein